MVCAFRIEIKLIHPDIYTNRQRHTHTEREREIHTQRYRYTHKKNTHTHTYTHTHTHLPHIQTHTHTGDSRVGSNRMHNFPMCILVFPMLSTGENRLWLHMCVCLYVYMCVCSTGENYPWLHMCVYLGFFHAFSW
jgi:hypothetical protein